LDGTSRPDELIERAAELGYSALALTDHDSVAGAMELAVAARQSSVRAIFGTELTVAVGEAPGDGPAAAGFRSGGRGGAGGGLENGSGGQKMYPDSAGGRLAHVTLLVADGHGWRNLCRLLTLAHAHTRERTDRRATQPSVSLATVLEHSDGLVCLTGCAQHGIHDERTMRILRSAFGPERLRVELQRPYTHGDRARNRSLELLASRLSLRTVATGDVHAHTPARALLQDALVAIRHGLSLDGSETVRRANHTHVLASPRAMAARFADHPEAVTETVRLAEMLCFELTGDLGYRYPGHDDGAATRALSAICQLEFLQRYPSRNPSCAQAQERLRTELCTIDALGLSGFFLLHHEILGLAHEVACEVRGKDSARALLQPGRGRGSSVSSIVCYLTGLSHIDPIANDLAIGRFLHEDITSLPDIDIDFPRDIRERLIPRIVTHYGAERAALVAAFPTYRAKGAIRELGKALGLPPGEIERVARGSEGRGSEGSVASDIVAALGAERLQSGRWAWLSRLADEASGLPRHMSQHPGGMVISTRPLIDCCPVLPAAMAERQMVQWDKDSCSDAGFLKIDLLGLGMLSAVERCVDLIALGHNERVDLSRIDFDDARTFACIAEAKTTGVFQIESRAQMGSLRRTRPQSLADLTIQVALVRPGPIVGGAVNPYIERRQRLRADPSFEVPYLHHSLRGPLAETLGTIIFQDQVIEVARAFASFSAGEAEGLRRAMSRKRSEEAIAGHRKRFIEGACRTHEDVDERIAEEVWAMVKGFAGFGFPKAHGAAFGLLAYQSTWLRVHYPAEFLCALLNEQPMGFYPPDSLIGEAQGRGVEVLAPDVNHSGAECTLANGCIRVGLAYVKGLGAPDIDALLAARANGPFASLEDLVSRSGLAGTALQRLAWAGACGELVAAEAGMSAPSKARSTEARTTAEHSGTAERSTEARSTAERSTEARDTEARSARRTALWKLGVPRPAAPAAGGRQLALPLPLGDAPTLQALTDWELMIADYASTGISIEHHPLALLRDALGARGALDTAELLGASHGSQVTVGGLVIARQRPATANGITFLLIEDECGTLNVIVPRRLYESRRQVVRTEPLLLVQGRLERHASGGGAINLLARTLAPLRHCTAPAAPVTALMAHDQSASDARDAGAGAGMAAAAGGRRGGGSGEVTDPGALAPTGTDGFAAVAPPALSFAQGRRR
jgi:error-prone DNA polymerase